MTRRNVPSAPNAFKRATRTQAAAFFEVALTTVDGWVRRGAPVVKRGSKGVPSEYDLRALAEWLYAGQMVKEDADPDTMSPQDRKAWYDSETKRRDLQVKDGELIPRPEVERVVATAFAALQQDTLAIPDRLERQHGIRPEVAEKVGHALHGALEAMAERLARLAPVDAPEDAAA